MRLPTAQAPGVSFLFSFLFLLGYTACGRSEPKATSAQVTAPVTAPNRAEGLPAKGQRSSAAASPGAAHAKAPAQADDAAKIAAGTNQTGDALADKFADLETLCAALNKDYVDGTLTDYYQNLSLTTAFGKDLRRRGEASMKPGRILEAGLASLKKTLGQDNADDPATPACAQLFDELDDLE